MARDFVEHWQVTSHTHPGIETTENNIGWQCMIQAFEHRWKLCSPAPPADHQPGVRRPFGEVLPGFLDICQRPNAGEHVMLVAIPKIRPLPLIKFTESAA